MAGLLSDWPDGAGAHPQRLGQIEQLLAQLTTVAAATYGATVATDAAVAAHVTVAATNGTAFTIAAPANAKKGRTITFDISNTSGGSLGTVTWNAVFKLDATGFANPANGKRKTITFRHDGSAWVQLGPTSADI